MFIFEYDLRLYQLVVPTFTDGILAISLLLFFYMYYRTREKLYLAMMFLNLFAIIHVSSELLVLFFGGWRQMASLAMQFHRLEDLAATFFLFALPYYLSHLLDMNESWHRLNRLIWKAGLIVSIAITFIAFIEPDLFVSQTINKETWLINAWDHGRGKEGLVFFIRDIMVAFVASYTIACIAIDLWRHRKYQYLLLPLVGFIIAAYAGLDDILYVYGYSLISPLKDLFFSRFSVGISFFAVLAMAGIFKEYFDKGEQVEESYHNLENAYKILNSSEERFRQVAENMNEIFMIYDYRNRVFLYISPAFESVFNSPVNPLYQSPEQFYDFIYPEDRESLSERIEKGNLPNRDEVEYRIIIGDGTIRWVRHLTSVIRDKNNEIYRLVSIIEDITERRKNQEELFYIAYHDILTGLPNRRAFFEQLYQLISQAIREEPRKNKALLFIDLDRFKNINDTFGHSFGDKLLKTASEKMKSCLRKSDNIYRLGSDEFTIILNGIADDLDAAVVANKIIDEFSSVLVIDEREIFLNLSIGISIYPKDGEDADTILKHADIALQESKIDSGTYRFFDSNMNKKFLEKLKIENSVRQALMNDQFCLFYQPFVDDAGKIIGMEALIRWKDDRHNAISPDIFIPIAESSGLIFDIGDWTINRACFQLAKWKQMGYNEITLSVNLSAQQFRDKGMVNKIKGVMEKYSIEGKDLVLEITESSIMDNPENTVKIMKTLTDMGIRFSIDDFGIGYSSLNYLKQYSIHHLKIDRSFIRDLIIDDDNTEITKAIIAMSHKLKMKVVAEGVETPEQAEFLKTLHCDIYQGYLFSRALDADEFEKLLAVGYCRF